MNPPGAWVTVQVVRNLARRAVDWQRRHPTAADAVVAVLFAVAGLVAVSVSLAAARDLDVRLEQPPMTAVVVTTLAVTLPLAGRRRFPLSAATAVTVAFVVERVLLQSVEPFVTVYAVWLALYSAVVYGRPGRRRLVLALNVGLLLGEVVRELFFLAPQTELALVARSFLLLYQAAVIALPCLLGVAIRSLRERERELAGRATELRREREEKARRAVFEERVRIARELHDVVAHHVSVMGIQAGAARRVLDRHPEKATGVLSSIEASSRQAVVELHRLLGFLRRSGEEDQLGPQPGLAQLQDLVERVGRGALAVDLSVEGDPRPLPPTLDVSAYRIVQEALTNSLKHSGGATAAVRVRYLPASLEIEVLDDGGAAKGMEPPSAAADPLRPAEPVGPVDRSGQGLLGMRERASLHGGRLRAGPRPEGGFAVRASFPLDGSGP
jgi:signal transduction histidine kinase